jgi:ABC-2 type transport system ATP-binding protein
LLGEYTYQGRIEINGISTRRHPLTLKKIGFVPQLPPPLKMPVKQLLGFAADLCHSDPARMAAVADKLGLDVDQFKHKPFVKLSGGQKQKLLIAIALGRDADILILDEPAANLDPVARRIFFELLAQYPPETLMLMSSHRIDEVAALVNRVIELDQGRVILDDHVADSVSLDSLMSCALYLNRGENALHQSLNHWQFEQISPLHWQGRIAGADKLRFLGMISRYVGIIKTLHLEEEPS